MKALSIAAALALLVTTSSAHAIGSSGSSLDPAPTAKPKPKSPKKLACKRNQTAKLVKKKWTCVNLKVGALDDYDMFQQALALAEDGEYEWALDHLQLIQQQGNHEVLTYKGYSNRKAGRLETAIGYYQQALAVKPDFVEAREYLGEAYTLAGMTGEASGQLSAIKAVCGTDCEAYESLQKFMQTNNSLDH
jgi:tetratricopeptide (TPR) repeat protein